MGSALMVSLQISCVFVRGTFCVLPLIYVDLPKSASAYLFSQSAKTHYICSGPIRVDPIFVRNRMGHRLPDGVRTNGVFTEGRKHNTFVQYLFSTAFLQYYFRDQGLLLLLFLVVLVLVLVVVVVVVVEVLYYMMLLS